MRDWYLSSVWDEAFNNSVERPVIARDYLYASQLGTSFIDCYHALKGVKPTNLPTLNANRKMESGKVWESVLYMTLKRAGILKSSQEKIDFSTDGMIEVHGKCDFIAGGKVDIQQALEFAEQTDFFFTELQMPDIYKEIATRMVDFIKSLESESGIVELAEYVIECKSVSAFVFDLVEAKREPSPYHKFQIFHYLKGLNLAKGKIIYINRDDARMLELTVYNDEKTYSEYKTWLKCFDYCWQNNEEPPKEPTITFNAETQKFYKNTVGVEWSRYLTMLYGYESPTQYRDAITPMVTKINYAFTRAIQGQKITESNKEGLELAKDFFKDLDELIDRGKLWYVLKTENEQK